MVLLNVDHPDIEEFVACKAIEERRSRDLAAAGWDMSLNGDRGLRYQNANNSVRVSDSFMQAVVDGGTHDLVARTTGEATKTLLARDLVRSDSRSGVGMAPIPECSTPTRSTVGTHAPSPDRSTGPTPARSTFTWTTPPATWPRSTC